jgi:starch phosphorylase
LALGDIHPESVNVELYFGNLNPAGEIVEGVALPMVLVEKKDDGTCIYEGKLLCLRSGQFGYTVRVLPTHANMSRKFEPKLITWA